MTLILEPRNASDYQLFVELAKRLNVNFRVADTPNEGLEKHFFSLAGSLDIPESGEDFLALIEKGKNSKDLDFTF